MFIRYLIILALVTLSASRQHAFAQRYYGLSDSTVYEVNPVFQLVAGRDNLYKIENNGPLQFVRDFYDPLLSQPNAEYYIRDVAFWDEHHWYVLYGSRYTGNITQLFETTDGGANWSLKTDYESKTNWPAYNISTSLNQLQVSGDSTLYLFNGYYRSSVVYSKDRGQTWTRWFCSMIAHYYQIHTCTNGEMYMIGMPGDGFQSTSFIIPDSLKVQTDVIGWMSGCHNGNQPQCNYASGPIGYPYVERHKFMIDSLCALQAPVQHIQNSGSALYVFPNPARERLFAEGLNAASCHYDIYAINGLMMMCGIYDAAGIDISRLPSGSYMVRFSDGVKQYRQVIVVY